MANRSGQPGFGLAGPARPESAPGWRACHPARRGTRGRVRSSRICFTKRRTYPGVDLARVSTWLIACLTLLCCSVHAQLVTLEIGSSPNPVGSGARAMGQGNAFIAVADDATAASWNPGGLTRLERPEFSFALDALARDESLCSKSHPESNTTDDLELADFNYASVVVPVYWGRPMVLSLSYIKQYSFDKSALFPYALDVAGTDLALVHELEQEGAFAAITPAFAIRATPRLSLGIAANFWDHGLTQSSSYHSTERSDGTLSVVFPFPIGRLQSRFIHVVEHEYEVTHGCSLALGAFFRATRHWTLGAVAKPPFDLTLEHTSLDWYNQFGPAGGTPGPQINRARRRATLRFPWILGAGAAWRPADPLTLSLDATWTQWSEYAFEENGRDTNPLTGQAVSQSELDDTFTCRFGAEYLLIGEKYIVPLRCGTSYDPAPGVDETDHFYTFSLGTGFQTGRWNLDVAYEFRWGNDVNAASLGTVDATQDVHQHRVLVSLIVYL